MLRPAVSRIKCIQLNTETEKVTAKSSINVTKTNKNTNSNFIFHCVSSLFFFLFAMLIQTQKFTDKQMMHGNFQHCCGLAFSQGCESKGASLPASVAA